MNHFVTCNSCQHEFVLDLEERLIEPEKFDVGCECPMCHTWYHGYFTTPRLKAQAQRLAAFRQKTGKSQRDTDRYHRKLVEYRNSFTLVNPGQEIVAL